LSPAGDGSAVRAPQSGDSGAATHARALKEMPPVLSGHFTPALQARADSFYRGVAEMFERWAARHDSSHTRRAYRRDVLSFVDFLALRWPQQAEELLRASVADVQRWRDVMREQSKARRPRPSTAIHPRSRASTSTWSAPPPSSACPSTCLIPPMPSLSPANPPTRSKARARSLPRAPASSWACLPAIACSTTGTAPF